MLLQRLNQYGPSKEMYSCSFSAMTKQVQKIKFYFKIKKKKELIEVEGNSVGEDQLSEKKKKKASCPFLQLTEINFS